MKARTWVNQCDAGSRVQVVLLGGGCKSLLLGGATSDNSGASSTFNSARTVLSVLCCHTTLEALDRRKQQKDNKPNLLPSMPRGQ